MSDPFARALDAIYRGSWAKSATYTPPTPPGGAAVAVTVVVGAPEQLGDPSFLAPAGLQLSAAAQAVALVAKVRRSELAEPKAGGTLAIAGEGTYPVQSIGQLDTERLEWPLVLGKRV